MMQNNYMIGVTGNIGSGKSTLCKMLASEFDYPTISADVLTLEAYDLATDKLRDVFGDGIFNDGKVDKKKLGRIVFASEEKLNVLGDILHPIIMDLMIERGRKYGGVVFLEIPLLFEVGAESKVDEVWLVYMDERKQLERISLRDNISFMEATRRMESQGDVEIKKDKSHILFNNDGDESALKKQLVVELEKLKERLKK